MRWDRGQIDSADGDAATVLPYASSRVWRATRPRQSTCLVRWASPDAGSRWPRRNRQAQGCTNVRSAGGWRIAARRVRWRPGRAATSGSAGATRPRRRTRSGSSGSNLSTTAMGLSLQDNLTSARSPVPSTARGTYKYVSLWSSARIRVAGSSQPPSRQPQQSYDARVRVEKNGFYRSCDHTRLIRA